MTGFPKISGELAFALLLVIASGTAAVVKGQDANLDLYRYRLYNGYAFVHGRLDQDFAPAALGTYLNPVLDAFHYLGIAHLPPRVFSFLLGSVQGLNAVLVLLLARSVLPADPSSRLLALLAALLAASGPTARSLLGTTLGDTTASLPALAALLLASGAQAPSNGRSRVLPLLCAGLFGGVAVGLKLTMATALIALGAWVASGLLRRQLSVAAALASLAGVVLGYLAVAGYWCWQLWKRFGNPLFPFANHVFRSPYLPAEAIRDSRWKAGSLMDYVVLPVDMALGLTERLQEIPFRDARFLLVLLAALVWWGLRVAGRRPALRPAAHGLLVYFLVGYVAWALAFYYYRYAAVQEYLAPLALVVLVRAAAPMLARSLLVAATVLVVFSSSVGSWGRLDFGDGWFNIRLPPQAHDANSLVLLDSSLSSFLIPYFPPATRFAGLEGVGSSRFEELLSARIAAHRGSLFWLVSRGRPADSTPPDRFGVVVSDECGMIRTGEGRWALCRVLGPRGSRW